MALIYRAHFALIKSPRQTSTGQCTSAVFGVANTLLDIINREKPTHIAAATDTSDPTARHVLYPQYKATREDMPEDLASQLPWVYRLIEAFNVPVIRMPGYEADDIIGTLARMAALESFQTLMVTPDKDFEQLVGENSLIWKPGRQGGVPEVMGVAEVLAKWEIQRPYQVIEILALMGDTSDNVPGVPGIGPKTASKLIQEFGTVENLLSETGKLKGKQRESLERYAEQARLSKQLVTIQLDVPLSFTLGDFAWSGFDTKSLQDIMQELEFETLGKRLFGEEFTVTRNAKERRSKKENNPVPTSNSYAGLSLFENLDKVEVRETGDAPSDVALNPTAEGQFGQSDHLASKLLALKANYSIVRTKDQRTELLKQLLTASEVCFDAETTGLDPKTARPLGIAFAIVPHEAWYVVLPENLDEITEVLDDFRPLFESPSIAKIGHNLKYDLTLLKWYGIQVQGVLVDTMLAHVIVEPEMEHGMDFLAETYLDYQTIKIEQLIGGRGPNQRNMADVPVEFVGPYACEDADITLQLSHRLLPKVEQQGLHKVCYEVEFPLVRVLVDMEYAGIRLDAEALKRFSVQLESEITQLEQKIYESAGRRFNIDSPKQLGSILYNEIKVEEKPKKTATGQYSTRESELERLKDRHPIIEDILDYRNATKLKRTYVDTLPGFIDGRTGRLHTNYSQAWTATGRMQSNNPNLQTIPIRKQRGREIRAAFVPRDENYWILSADYSQIELRIMAELSGDPAMLEAFQKGIDIHAATASKVFGVPVESVSREMRSTAKSVNFGIIYGISAFGLQRNLNISKSDAADLINNYFIEYPQVKTYIDETVQFARKHGYVETMTGRRRYLRDINSRNRTAASAAERLAMNSPIQGTAADVLKLAMIRVDEELKRGGFQTKMLLTVHDEIVFDLHKDEVDQGLPLIRSAMENAWPMKVPLVVDAAYGDNWLAAH